MTCSNIFINFPLKIENWKLNGGQVDLNIKDFNTVLNLNLKKKELVGASPLYRTILEHYGDMSGSSRHGYCRLRRAKI